MYQHITGYFFPSNFSGTSDDFRRARIIVNSVLLTGLFACNYIALSWWANYWQGVYVLCLTVLAFIILLFLFRADLVSYRTVGYGFNILVANAIFWCGYYQGGFSSDVAYWLAVQPLLSTLLLGRTGGFVSLSITALLLLLFWYLEYRDIYLPNYVAAEFRLLFRFNVMTGLMLIVMVIALVFYETNARAMAVIEEKNDLLSRRSDELQLALNHLHETQTQLVHKEKMASLGELTAGIAHEIQNPLNFVNNFADISHEIVEELTDELRRPNPDNDTELELLNDLANNLQKISHHGNRASSIVKGMLEHSRTSPGQKELTNLNALIDELLGLSYHGMRAKDKLFNATLVTDFDPNLGPVRVVGQDIGRVLINLFNNGFYAVHQKRLSAPTNYQPTLSVSTRLVANRAEIRVRDNGNGIPQALLTKIFQPFFTTKPSGEGTGLGLSLSYDIITIGHNGSLTVNTQEGVFTEFLIELPVD